MAQSTTNNNIAIQPTEPSLDAETTVQRVMTNVPADEELHYTDYAAQVVNFSTYDLISNDPKDIIKTKFKTEEEIDPKPMSYDEKRRLYLNIINVSGHTLNKILQIIQSNESTFHFDDLRVDEFEIDFGTLKPLTLRKLESFVSSMSKNN